MVQEPDLDTFVVCRAKGDVGLVQIGEVNPYMLIARSLHFLYRRIGAVFVTFSRFFFVALSVVDENICSQGKRKDDAQKRTKTALILLVLLHVAVEGRIAVLRS